VNDAHQHEKPIVVALVDVRQILGLSAVLYDLSLDELEIIAAAIGPTPAAIRVPLDGSQGNTRTCPVFREHSRLSGV
jgi:hypothetical protein